MRLSPGDNLTKLFLSKITPAFCKLDPFINISNYGCIGMKDLAYKIE